MNVRNNKETRRSAKTLALTACLLLCAMAPMVAYADDDSSVDAGAGTLKYVSLGDSMVNGFGMTGYYSELGNSGGFMNIVGDEEGESKTYPSLLTDYLGQFYDVEHVQLAISGMRTADLRVLIDETFTDELKLAIDADIRDAILAENGYIGGEEGLSQFYIDNLADADLISYQFNFDFGMYMANAITELMGYSNGYSPNFDAYLDEASLAMISNVKDQIYTNIVDPLVANGTIDSWTVEALDAVLTTMAFVVMSYCMNFDANMEKIFEINPDATVVVIDSYSTNSELILDLGGSQIPMGTVLNSLNRIANTYVQYFSPYAGAVLYTSLPGIPALLADAFVDAEDGSEIDNDSKNAIMASLTCDFIFSFDMNPVMNEEFYLDYDRVDEYGKLTEFLSYLFSENVMSLDVYGRNYYNNYYTVLSNINALLGDLEGDTPGILQQPDCQIEYDADARSCVITSSAGEVEFNKEQMMFMWFHVRITNYTNIMGHLSGDGHDFTFYYVLEALNDVVPQTPSDGYLLDLTAMYGEGGNIAQSTADSLGLDLLDVNLPMFTRGDDLVYLLGALDVRDAYTDRLIANYCADLGMSEDELRMYILDAVAKSDTIMINISVNNMVYAIEQISMYLNQGGQMDDLNFSKFGTMSESLFTSLDNLADTVLGLLETIYADDPQALQTIQSIDVISDNLAYAIMGYMTSYSAAIDMILDINPSAEIIVVGAYNIFDGFVYQDDATGVSVDVGAITGALVAGSNLFYGLQLMGTNYVDISGVHTNDTIINLADMSALSDFAAILPSIMLSEDEAALITDVVGSTYDGQYFTLTIDFLGDITFTEVEFGAPIVVPELPTMEGYICEWNTVPPATMPATNLALVAEWRPITYTIEFDANGGSGYMASQEFEYDVADDLDACDFVKDGYNFVGWNTEADGTGIAYQDAEEILNLTIVDGDEIVLYAQWESEASGHVGLSPAAIGGIVAVIIAALFVGYLLYRRN